MQEHTYRQAADTDGPAIEALLLAAGLPLDGAQEHLAHLLVGETGSAIHCVGGYEHYGEVALLRSVAVAEEMRGQGVGAQLLEAIKARARADNIGQLYLLTTTAADFFARRGFIVVERVSAPDAVRSSRQFQGICPASATMMVAPITAGAA